MLLEAWRIAQALKAAGIETAARCSDITTPGRTGGPVVRAVIGVDLSVEFVPVPDEELGSLWSFRQANFHFWPVLRLAGPLCADELDIRHWMYDLAKAKEERSVEKRRIAVDCVLAAGVRSMAPDSSRFVDTHRRESSEHTAKLEVPGVPQNVVILRERVDRLIENPYPFEDAIAIAADNPLVHAALFALLCGKVQSGKLRGDGQVALDLQESTIYTQETRQQLEAALSRGSAGSGDAVICELSGELGMAHRGKLPAPQLPVVAASGIAMFSMFREAETNFRYGLADSDIVQLSQETIGSAQNALAFVTAGDKKGVYWRPFPNGKSKNGQDLLIAYAEGVDTSLADGFGGSEEDGTAYAETLAPVLDALQGKAKLTPRASVLLVLLRQISNAQIQSVYCRAPLASEVLKSGRRWIVAQRDRPPLLCDYKKERLLSPAQLVRMLSGQRSGRPPKFSNLNGPSGADALDFMLAVGDDRRRRGDALLDLLLQRAAPALAYYAAEARREMMVTGDPGTPMEQKEKGRSLRADVDRLCRLMALLFDAKEKTLDETTHSPAYLLGLLLGVVDTLHLAYCRKVRGGEAPPSLGGSQLLGIASDDPTRALSDLLERIRPWYDWADTASPAGDDWLTLRAKKAVSRLSTIAPLIAGHLTSERLDNVSKAELLLGFLSRDAVADQYGESPATESEKNHG